MTKQYAPRGSLQGPKGDTGPAGADGGITPHAARHATGGSDPVTPAAIGAATSGHSHPTPLVPNPRVALAYAATITPNAALGCYHYCTLGGAATLNPPSSPTEDQVLRIRFKAASAFVVTFSGSFQRSTDVLSTATCPAAGYLDVGMLYDSAAGWTILAATPTQ